MEYKNLLFGVEEEIALITFNRPKALNAMNSETMKELLDVVTCCRNDDGIKALILTGAGEKAFVAGADIAEITDRIRHWFKETVADKVLFRTKTKV